MDWESITLPIVLLAVGIGSTNAGRADPVQDASVETLKEIYIECEQRALSQVLPTGDIARCSEVYETLKLRAFGGDWTRLREWFEELSVAEAQV
jgi:hypothetical protein